MPVVRSVEALSVHQRKHVKIYLLQIVNVSMEMVMENTILVASLVMDRLVVQMLVVEIYQYLRISVSIQIATVNMMLVDSLEQDRSVHLHNHVSDYPLLYEIEQMEQIGMSLVRYFMTITKMVLRTNERVFLVFK